MGSSGHPACPGSARIAGCQFRIRQREIRVVEDVEGLCAQSELEPLTQVKRLKQGHVEVHIVRTAILVAGLVWILRVHEAGSRSVREGRCVQTGSQFRVGHNRASAEQFLD